MLTAGHIAAFAMLCIFGIACIAAFAAIISLAFEQDGPTRRRNRRRKARKAKQVQRWTN